MYNAISGMAYREVMETQDCLAVNPVVTLIYCYGKGEGKEFAGKFFSLFTSYLSVLCLDCL